MEQILKQLNIAKCVGYCLLEQGAIVEDELKQAMDQLVVNISDMEDEIEFIIFCNTSCWRYKC